MNTRQIVFGFVLGVTCAYHLGIGLVSCLAPETTLQLASLLYGIHASEIPPQVIYMLKALGMYALFTGGLLALAMTDARRYRHVILAAAALLVMRATTRLLFHDLLEEAFHVAWGRNLVNVAILLTQAGVLAALAPRPEEASAPAPQPTPAPARRRPTLGEVSGLGEVLASASARLAPLPSTSGISTSGIRTSGIRASGLRASGLR